MANYSFRCDEIVSARTQFLTPGGDPSTFRSVNSSRRKSETVTASDTLVKGKSWSRRGSDTVTVVDGGHTIQRGKGFHRNEVVSAVDHVRVKVIYKRRVTELVRARETTKVVHTYVIRHSDTVSAVDQGTGRKQFWIQRADTVQAVDSKLVSGKWVVPHADVATAVDSVRVQIRQRPGVGLTLHPNRDGTYQNWLRDPPGNGAWQNVSEKIPDGDTTTVYVNSEPGEAVTFALPPILIPVACPQRIAGLTLRLVAKGDGATLKPRFVLRDRVFDGEEFALDGTWRSYYTWWPVNVFGGRPWTTSTLVDLEVGVVNTGTAPVALTTVTAFVATEPTPFRYPLITSGGKRREWSAHPTTGSDFDALRQEDGGRSYLFATSAITAGTLFDIFNSLDGKILRYSTGGPTRQITFDGRETLTHTGPGHSPINMDEVINQIQEAGITVHRANVFGEQNPTGGYLSFPRTNLTLIFSGSTAWDDLGLTGVTDLVSTYGQQHTIRSADSDLWIPPEFRVDKVNLVLRAKGEGEIAPLILDEDFEFLGPYGKWPLILSESLQTYQIPFYNRPAFPRGMSRWGLDDVLAADWGVQNETASEVQLDYVKLEVFASLFPEEEVRLIPTDDGNWADWSIGAPDVGESPFQDVNSYLPDDSSYLHAAAVSNSPAICTFPAGISRESNWYNLRWRVRLRQSSGYTDGITFAPFLVLPTDHHVGRQFHLKITGTEFSEVVEDFWVNPTTGKPWSPTELQDIEIGIILYSGEADLSWCVADAGVVPPREHSSSSFLCEFTDVGQANIARAVSDALIWKIDRYQVGRGGYQRDNPAVTQPLVTSDSTLEDPVYTGKIAKVSSDGMVAHYWIAVPPDVISEPIGEIMLLARIVSSSNPSDTPGTYFPMAVAHFPAGFHTMRSIRVMRLDLYYASLPPPLFNWGGGNWGGHNWGQWL